MHKTVVFAALVATATGSLATFGANASAQGPDPALTATYQELSTGDMAMAGLDDAPLAHLGPNAAATVSIDSAATKSVRIGDGSADFSVSFEGAGAHSINGGLVSYSSRRSGFLSATPTVKDDGSVQISMVRTSAAAPSTSSFAFALAPGQSLSVDDNGAVDVLNADGSYAGGTAVPDAVDASGNAVPVTYTVSGSTVTQTLAPTATTSYPVVSPMWLGFSAIDKVKWETVSKWSPTAAVYPTWWGRHTGAAARWSAWGEAKKKGGSRMNTGTMETQFMCHFDAVRIYAPNKPSWDLDSKRPNTSEVNEIKHKCNYPDGGNEW